MEVESEVADIEARQVMDKDGSVSAASIVETQQTVPAVPPRTDVGNANIPGASLSRTLKAPCTQCSSRPSRDRAIATK